MGYMWSRSISFPNFIFLHKFILSYCGFLIGNKEDLEDNRKVSKEAAKEFAENNKIKLFLETSAKTGFNAQNIFIEAAKLLYEQHLKYKDRVSRLESISGTVPRESNQSNAMNIMNIEEDEDRKKKGCCK